VRAVHASSRPPRASRSLPVQARFNLSDIEGTRHSAGAESKVAAVTALKKALEANQETLEKYEAEDAVGDVAVYVKHPALEGEIAKMFDSSIDYGEVDVRNPQQLALIYFRLKRALDPAQREGGLETARETGRANAHEFIEGLDKGSYERRVKHEAELWGDGKIAKVYELAILGAGASAAYYIVNNLHAIDPSTSILIGEEQPWRTERGEKGVINHPMNMISPSHQRGGGLQDATGGLAARKDLSDQVDVVVGALERRKAKILSVKKQGYVTKHYRIDIGSERIYAKKVVAGLGIGKHKLPDDIAASEEKRQAIAAPENALKLNVPRVLNMDQFQSAISDGTLLATDIESMVISGPNAAIDVATTAIREKIKNVSWIVGYSGPMFLPGTDNVYAARSEKRAEKTDLDDQVKRDGDITYYGYYYTGVEVSSSGVKVEYGRRADRRGDPPIPVGTIEADLLVYGLGPDAESLRQLFTISDRYNEEEAIPLEPVYDINQHFNRDESEAPEEGVRAFFTRHFATKKGLSGEALESKVKTAMGIYDTAMKSLPEKPAERREPRPFATPAARKLPAVLGLRATPQGKDDESSLEIIGGSAYRLADDVKYAYVSKAYRSLLDDDYAELEGSEGKEQGDAGSLRLLKQDLEFGVDVARKMEGLTTWSQPDEQYFEARLQALARYLEQARGREQYISEAIRKRYGALVKRTGHCLAMLAEYLSNRRQSQDEQNASTHMLKIPKTLPQNVLLGDQLTAVRSSVEAQHESVPGSVEQGVNFITSDGTVIAAHIATAYGNIPPAAADLLTRRVVFDRRHLADDIGPLPAPRNDEDPGSVFDINAQNDFQKKWSQRLKSIDEQLEKAYS